MTAQEYIDAVSNFSQLLLQQEKDAGSEWAKMFGIHQIKYNVKSHLQKIVKPGKNGLHLHIIVDCACRVFGVNVKRFWNELCRRDRELVEVREAVSKFCMDFEILSSTQLGYQFKKDHSTIVDARKVAGQQCEVDPVFRKKYETMKAEILATTTLSRANNGI